MPARLLPRYREVDAMKKRNSMLVWVVLLVVTGLSQPASAANIALQIERSTAGSLATSSNVICDTTVYSAGNISYNSLTGVIVFNEAGRYIVTWWVAYQLVDSDNATAVLALSTSQGDFLEASSPSPSGQVTGVGIVDVSTAPVTLSLVNASTGTLYYPTASPIKASVTIVEDDIPSP